MFFDTDMDDVEYLAYTIDVSWESRYIDEIDYEIQIDDAWEAWEDAKLSPEALEKRETAKLMNKLCNLRFR